jgi:hypothetical protein
MQSFKWWFTFFFFRIYPQVYVSIFPLSFLLRSIVKEEKSMNFHTFCWIIMTHTKWRPLALFISTFKPYFFLFFVFYSTLTHTQTESHLYFYRTWKFLIICYHKSKLSEWLNKRTEKNIFLLSHSLTGLLAQEEEKLMFPFSDIFS